MRMIKAALVLVIVAALAQGCTVDGDSEDATYPLLMAATFGDGAGGSYTRFDDPDVLVWRSRTHYTGADGMQVVDGYGDCMDDDLSTVVNFDSVYFFDQISGLPLYVSETGEVFVLPRPISRFPEPESFSLEELQPGDDGELDFGLVPFDPEAARLAQQQLEIDVDIPPELEEQLSQQSLLPTPLGDDLGREEFVEAVENRLRLIEEAFGGELDPVVGLDIVLIPSMWHGSGGDDPTAAPPDAASQHLIDAASVSAEQEQDRTVWIADFGLPDGANAADWENQVDDTDQDRQARPQDDQDVTHQFAHGLMVASVAAQAAPGADVRMINLSIFDAGADDYRITVESMDQALWLSQDSLWTMPGTLNFSLGAYDCELNIGGYSGGVVSALFAVLEPYIAKSDLLVVGAAGNDGQSAPFFPAAFPGVVGVGADDVTVLNADDCLGDGVEAWTAATDGTSADCTPDGGKAEFSNNEINARTLPGDPERFEPGVDVIVDYPLYDDPVDYHYHRYEGETDPLDTGRVRISGTSFAAPFVAACSQPDGTWMC